MSDIVPGRPKWKGTMTDCDGDVRPILPLMMEGGINCLFPFEVNGCAHPAELLNEYGKDLRIMGGVDKIEKEKMFGMM